jgi:hypothetical protein
MNRALQDTDAFVMNDTHLEDSSLKAGCQILRHQFLYFARLEGM